MEELLRRLEKHKTSGGQYGKEYIEWEVLKKHLKEIDTKEVETSLKSIQKDVHDILGTLKKDVNNLLHD